ncbi:PLP-dependent aminotransferase family protein [Bradyrhizobium sp. SZCCHNRI1003]|uniref:aminotransferase-like domain-containing protein n=1 Tax=Bradyrhizobium sp. SZCCHNRI1003 TaxID=3057275 RepID=UPI0029161F60|nr:PLP-dependent aminotransferase family protein [Bradyrhizobium sp. SZCCHNRI1003]
MLERSSWQPRLAPGPGLLHERLATAFAEDIVEQVIAAGARLPAHRDLAYRLGVSVGTVTKAYGLLERQGLVKSDKGRATFAIGTSRSRSPFIDLSVNVPPRVISDRLLSATMSEVAKSIDANTFNAYPPPEGEYAHRATVAAWISEVRLKVRPEEVILCNGARHALSIAFSAVHGPGTTILTEALPYHGALQICQAARMNLEGLPMDAEGMDADALRSRLERGSKFRKACVVYVTPTAQNPTGRSMSLARRLEIVDVCRTFETVIIEDDVYAAFGDKSVPTIRELAPERTIYVGGLSKTLTPGLRIGFLVCTEKFRATAIRILTALGSPVSPLCCLIMDRWIVNGTASHLSDSVCAEASRRMALASQILGCPPTGSVLHAFLELPPQTCMRVAWRAAELGVRVTAPSICLRTETPVGIRLCLGGPPIDQLEQALRLVGGLL